MCDRGNVSRNSPTQYLIAGPCAEVSAGDGRPALYSGEAVLFDGEGEKGHLLN